MRRVTIVAPGMEISEHMQNCESSGASTADAIALLGWWREAGADMLAADDPLSWFAYSAQAAPVSPPVPALRAEAPAPLRPHGAPPAASDDTNWDIFPTVQALVEHVRAEYPHAPIADGKVDSGIMIIGEGPSAEDLRTGLPFTGPAGKLLDRMLAAIGLHRGTCYTTLAAPRRTLPGPVPADGMAADLALTRAHIRLAAPRLVLLLGGPATHILTGDTAPISRQRGQWREIHIGNAVFSALPTYNPAYLLRRPEAKRETWADLQAFRRRWIA